MSQINLAILRLTDLGTEKTKMYITYYFAKLFKEMTSESKMIRKL